MSTHVGIIGLGIYLPEQTMSASEISEKTNGTWAPNAVKEKLGINQIHIATDKEGTQEMGALAAEQAIKDAGINPLDIDVILSIGEEWKEYPLTTSALYIQDFVRADNAWGIDVQNRCCTSLTAMKIAKDMMIADPDVDTVLIAGGYRNGDLIDYTNAESSMFYNLSAGGGAIILQKNAGKNELLGSALISDGSFARHAGVKYGGINNPINHDNLDKAYESLELFEAEKMKQGLNEVSMDNWLKCIDLALERSNYTLEDVDFLNILHIKRSAHEYMVQRLGLSEEQSIYLEDYGHIGQIDQILSLILAREEGKIEDGSVICSIAAGIGYVWAANIIKWGPIKNE